MDLQVIKKNFSHYRELKGLSWADLAAKAGVTNYQSIFNRINGKGLTLASLEKLANLVDCEPYELLKPFDQDTTKQPIEPIIFCPHCNKPIYLTISPQEPGNLETENKQNQTLF